MALMVRAVRMSSALARYPVTRIRMIPGTRWCRWAPPMLRLWKGPRPARMACVMRRTTMKVSRKAISSQKACSLPV